MMKAKRKSKAARVSLDTKINMLPQSVLETILCLLPIEEAARTSILSREWRYKWTQIPKLVFYDSTLPGTDEYEGEETDDVMLKVIVRKRNLDRRWKNLCAVMHQVLLLHQGPIHEFSLSTHYLQYSSFELDQIILYLSRNHTLKKFSLDLPTFSSYKLPFSASSLQYLTDLSLSLINFHKKPIFSGFGNLKNLYLKFVRISSEALLHLLSNCPSLKRLSLFIQQVNICIIDLFKCLPMIEHLTTWDLLLEGLVVDSVPKVLPTSLLHLKYFCFQSLMPPRNLAVSFLAMLIKSSPNLEKIKLQIGSGDGKACLVEFEDSDVWLEHLHELEIEQFSNSEMELLKFILARSPKLKKVRLTTVLDKEKDFRMLANLLRTPRRSAVQIIVERCENHLPR